MNTLANLKKEWNDFNQQLKSIDDLSPQTIIRQHPTLKRTRLKLMIESTLLLLFLVFYYSALDGDANSGAVNTMLVLGVIFYGVVNVFSYLTLIQPNYSDNIIASLQRTKRRLRTAQVMSLIASVIFAITFLAYSSSAVIFTYEKRLIMVGMILTLVIMSVISYFVWNKRISHFNALISEF